MKQLTEFLASEGFIFQEFKKVEPKEIGSRKKIEIYNTIDTNGHYIAIFVVNQKSRFLIKNAKEIEVLRDKLIEVKEHNFKKNIFIIKSPVCSKAINYFKENDWIVYNDSM
jgi:hypothetical protein